MINSASNHGNFRKQANTLENNLSNVNTTLTNKVNTDLSNLNTTLTNKINTLDNTCKSTYLPKNAKCNTIIQQQNSTSNYTHLVQWESEGITYLKNKPHIGQHNSAIGGNEGIGTGVSGAIILVPYSTDADPWNQGVGLYIGKNTLKLDGNDIRFVKTVYKSGDNWYRIQSDNWIELGGKVARVFTGTVTFPKSFTEIPTVICACVYNRASTFYAREVYPNTVSTTGFTITNSIPAGATADYIKYYAFGY
jgi:hypothetical protein